MKSLLLRTLFVATLAGALALPPTVADAALNAYLNLKGSKQGDIKGSVVRKGKEGSISVISFSHEMISPRDSASGQATGKRMHKPLVVTMEVDRSLIGINQALVNNENITEFALNIGTAGKGGAPLYTIKLTNAAVASVRLVSPPGDAKATVEVSFTYQKIEWHWIDGGITAMDDWEAPVAAGAPKKPKTK